MTATRPERPDFVDRAPLRIAVDEILNATPEEVFDTLGDAPSWMQWFPNMRHASWITPPPHDVGSQRRVDVGGLRVSEEFVVWDRPHRWGFTFLEVNIPFARAGVELAELSPAAGGGTRVQYTMALDPPAPLRLLAPVLVPGIRRSLRQGLRGLDRHLADRRRAG